ncbi:MAG: phosphatase PAP2 family protein [Clostridia bacterium]|nr:phosphatase PAP2 family protein [Clostridia bacterium]
MLMEIESAILLWIQNNLRCDFLTPVMRVITTLGNGGAFWIVLTLLLLIFKRTRRMGVYCAASMLLTLLVVNLCIKPLAARTRPYELIEGLQILVSRPHDFSFPSGHSANSLTCAWTIFRLAPKKYGVPALVLAVLIALSRLYVGVHYPTDVLAGAAIGVLLSEVALRALRRPLRAWDAKRAA